MYPYVHAKITHPRQDLYFPCSLIAKERPHTKSWAQNKGFKAGKCNLNQTKKVTNFQPVKNSPAAEWTQSVYYDQIVWYHVKTQFYFLPV